MIVDLNLQVTLVTILVVFFVTVLFSLITVLTIVRQTRHRWVQRVAEATSEAPLPTVKARDTGTFPAARISPLPERWRTSTLMPVIEMNEDMGDDDRNVQVLIDFLRRETVQPVG